MASGRRSPGTRPIGPTDVAGRAAVITVRLTGGLGNQMFEYATGRAMALRTGGELRLDPTPIAYPGRHETPRSVAVDAFNISGRIAPATRSPLRRLIAYSPVATRLRDLLPGRVIADRRPLTVDQRIRAAHGPATLSGYWQREEYFADMADVIRADFTLASPPSSSWTALAEAMAGSGSVGVHVRRGDYVTNARANAHHGLAGAAYVRAAWEMLPLSGSERTFVFSDDPDWCRDNLGFLPDPTFVEGFADYEELVLLSCCHHKIIANSSFSWWAAWLGEPGGGTVVAPRSWLQNAAVGAPSPAPDRWLRC